MLKREKRNDDVDGPIKKSKLTRNDDDGATVSQTRPSQPRNNNKIPAPRNPQQPNKSTREFVFGGKWNNRYRIYLNGDLGQGSYGEVIEAYDTGRKTDVAIKICNDNKCLDGMKREKDIMKLLGMNAHKNFIVKYMTHFTKTSKTFCIVYESLEISMADHLTKPVYRSICLNNIRRIGLQIAKGLAFLADQRFSIVHADLKPENIMYTSMKFDEIRLIDFGLSFKSGTSPTHAIQTCNYRAPEVFFGVEPYTHKIDYWSLGATMMRMFTGQAMLLRMKKHRNETLVNMMVGLLGMPPTEFLDKRTKHMEFFTKISPDSDAYQLNVAVQGVVLSKSQPLSFYLNPTKTNCCDGDKHIEEEYKQFGALIRKLLAYDPSDRIDIQGILDDPFFNTQQAPSTSTSEPRYR